ncbi:MAG: TRAFs-binding domain-containing protein [Candidatus Thiodiazotropha sp.]
MIENDRKTDVETTVKPVCFVAMPFGRKPPPGADTPLVDFDAIYRVMADAITSAGLEAIRADFESGGGFIHGAMFERLLLAEYVIADLTFANPNVAYEVGVRHGASSGATILVCAQGEMLSGLPFDFAPFRVLPYNLGNDGRLSDEVADQLKTDLESRLHLARTGQLPVDNPIMQVTEFVPAARIDHQKTDTFLHRMRYASEVGERVSDALQSTEDPVAQLQSIENEILAGPDTVVQLHTALMAVYLGYRERKAYGEMVSLYGRLPSELKNKPVTKEQLALAYNRLAEQSAKQGDDTQAQRYRRKALDAVESIPDDQRTSETFGIIGRVYKGHYDAERRAGNATKAEAMLRKAIESYEAGVRDDPRDYYPGVNAVTLRLVRGTTEDLDFLQGFIPVVRFAVERAPVSDDSMEQYWQIATRLELATAARDWDAARDFLVDLLVIDAHGWMRETTVGNLEIQKAAFHDDPVAVERLNATIEELGDT